MKTGIILYLLGERALEENSDIHSEIRKVEPLADRVEVVGQHTGHFDISIFVG